MEKDLRDLLDMDLRQIQEEGPLVLKAFIEELLDRNKNDLRPLQVFLGCLTGCWTFCLWAQGAALGVDFEELEVLLETWKKADQAIMQGRLAVLYDKANVNLTQRSDHDPGYYPPSEMN